MIMCFAQVSTLVDAFVFATLLGTFEDIWSLTKEQLGWISGIYFAGYTIAVAVIMALTDRVDARRIYMVGCLTIAVAATGFMTLAEGFWSALAFRALAGFGLAGTYMPGLRVLVDRYEGPNEARSIAFYTASWSLGTAVSYFLAGWIGGTWGWQAAFGVAAACATSSCLLVLITLHPVTASRPDHANRLLDFRPVLRNRRAMGYVIAYCSHNWELFAFRSWVVAFLTFSLNSQAEPVAAWLAQPSRLAALTAIAAMVASIVGNEIAMRLDRAKVIAAIQWSTGGLSCVIGFLATDSYLLVAGLAVLYALMVQSDSASLTAGVIGAAEPGRRGATLAVHSLIGWTGSFAGPLVVGLVLGRFASVDATAWGFGFIAMGAVTFLGGAAVLFLSRNGGRRA